MNYEECCKEFVVYSIYGAHYINGQNDQKKYTISLPYLKNKALGLNI
jgi:hypothetical protein